MPLNAINYVLTKSVLDQAVKEDTGGEPPTDEQKVEINRAAALSAFVPGNLGLAVPFIVRDRIVGEDDGEGEEGDEGEVDIGKSGVNYRRPARATRRNAGDGPADRFTKRFTRRSTNQLADRLANRSAEKAEDVIVAVADRAFSLMGQIGNQLSSVTTVVGSITQRLDNIDANLKKNTVQLAGLTTQVDAVQKDVDTLKTEVDGLKASKQKGS